MKAPPSLIIASRDKSVSYFPCRPRDTRSSAFRDRGGGKNVSFSLPFSPLAPNLITFSTSAAGGNTDFAAAPQTS